MFNNADLSKIKIIRTNSISQGGGKITANINLLDLIKNGNQSQNIRLYDEDSIFVTKSEKPLQEQIMAINKTNLNPEQITLYISGNVVEPGPITIKKGSSLNQAIASTGGNKLFTGSIEFIRFGITDSQKGNLDLVRMQNETPKSIVMDGDIVHINKNLMVLV